MRITARTTRTTTTPINRRRLTRRGVGAGSSRLVANGGAWRDMWTPCLAPSVSGRGLEVDGTAAGSLTALHASLNGLRRDLVDSPPAALLEQGEGGNVAVLLLDHRCRPGAVDADVAPHRDLRRRREELLAHL